MTPQHVVSQLLEADAKNRKNLILLKKIILTVYLGRLQINGQSPDNAITLGNYLFDNERMMFDFTRLCDEQREVFQRWLLEEHQTEKNKSYFNRFDVNEYRGFTAEVTLSWWGRFKRWLQGNHTEHWTISDIDLSLHYQLLGIEMCHGQKGVLIGFNQLMVPPTGIKYKSSNDLQAEPLGNTKRVFITDNLVAQLGSLNLNTLQFEGLCKKPHPLAISITDRARRHKEMLDYRTIQKYVAVNPWYIQLWQWLRSLFYSVADPVATKKPQRVDNKVTLLYENETTSVYQRSNQNILVKEKRPDIENLVYCGGGAKIFAHIGVWKALNERGIAPKKYAGSSAGAIMALMCYLGYTAPEIAELFKYIRKEHLVYFDFNSRGISDPQSLKTALDYAIAQKVQQIVAHYKIPYPQGPITFRTLELLKLKYPDCGLGNELIVTATNKRKRQTKYFSFYKTPDVEISEAVKISASIPVIFRGTAIDGDDHNDGGILNNFPTDAFHADDDTFLESEYGNNMKTLAVQFDNGTERATIDRGMERVYREHFILNWMYQLLTGVKDPASGWEQDRMKLRKYAAQSIIVDVGTISTTGFSVDEKNQLELIENGYNAAQQYLSARYNHKLNGSYKNIEIMYSTFQSLEELLAYCCYRGNKQWFDTVAGLINKSFFLNKDVLMKRVGILRSLYFTITVDHQENSNAITFFGNEIAPHPVKENKKQEHLTFLALYPIFLKLNQQFLINEKEHDYLERARHIFTAKKPFKCLKFLAQIQSETHIIFHIFHNLVKELHRQGLETDAELHAHQDKTIYEQFNLLREVLYNHPDLFKPEYFATWDLSVRQGTRVLHALNTNDPEITLLCESLKRRSEPLQTFTPQIVIDKYEEKEVLVPIL